MINQNGNITKNIKENFGLSELTGYPRRISEAILPVTEVNNKVVNFVRWEECSTTGTSVIFTTDANKDFYLTGFTLSAQADATADNTSIWLDCVPRGDSARIIGQISKLTTTATSDNITVAFHTPILLARNSQMRHSSSFTVGSCKRSAIVYGYYVDNTGD